MILSYDIFNMSTKAHLVPSMSGGIILDILASDCDRDLSNCADPRLSLSPPPDSLQISVVDVEEPNNWDPIPSFSRAEGGRLTDEHRLACCIVKFDPILLYDLYFVSSKATVYASSNICTHKQKIFFFFKSLFIPFNHHFLNVPMFFPTFFKQI